MASPKNERLPTELGFQSERVGRSEGEPLRLEASPVTPRIDPGQDGAKPPICSAVLSALPAAFPSTGKRIFRSRRLRLLPIPIESAARGKAECQNDSW